MEKKQLDAVALSIRSLSMDAIQKANSGHPGLPLGCAELAAVLYGEILKHNPKNSTWEDRDRFVLSAGHGSMLLYAILHLSGYKVSLQDIENFRQIGSACAGHPEYGMTDGVETTTGPLGQGISTAVGMAIAESMLAARFNTADFKIVDHYTYSLVGEGCLMEGVSSEACSLAGHLGLGKLIVFYDENCITIDGSTDIAFTEDVQARYESYKWQVLKGSMYDMEHIAKLVASAKSDPRPTLIILKSEIGHGAPTVAGLAKAHGAPLGEDGIISAKKHLGLDIEQRFFVAPEAYAYFEARGAQFKQLNDEWNAQFNAWSQKYPEKRTQWDAFYACQACSASEKEAANTPELPSYKVGDSVATRNVSGAMLNYIAQRHLNVVGGSADLQGPNVTAIKNVSDYSKDNRGGRYIRYGIREFAMAAISNGIQIHGGLRAFCATFMIFSDYLRPALRLSALMKTPVIYILTHDSIFVGEDGPTHQPIETLASLRAIPNVAVIRPGDAEETVEAWQMAMHNLTQPTCLALTRQNITVYEKEDPDWRNTVKCGAYIVKKAGDTPDVTIVATGSEVSLALQAAKLAEGIKIRVVSVLNRELFLAQPELIRNTLVGKAKRVIVAEAGISMGWECIASSTKDIFCINRFGESGPAVKVAEHLGFTAEKLAELIKG